MTNKKKDKQATMIAISVSTVPSRLVKQLKNRKRKKFGWGGLSYLIKRGDTLSGISKRFNVDMNDLVQLNQIEDPDLIYAGDRLDVPRQLGQDQEERQARRQARKETRQLRKEERQARRAERRQPKELPPTTTTAPLPIEEEGVPVVQEPVVPPTKREQRQARRAERRDTRKARRLERRQPDVVEPSWEEEEGMPSATKKESPPPKEVKMPPGVSDWRPSTSTKVPWGEERVVSKTPSPESKDEEDILIAAEEAGMEVDDETKRAFRREKAKDPRGKVLPLFVRQYMYDTLGGSGDIEADDLSSEEFNALKKVTVAALKKGKRIIDYNLTREVGGASGTNVQTADFDFSNPADSIQMTLGKAGIHVDDNGDVFIKDQYNWNDADERYKDSKYIKGGILPLGEATSKKNLIYRLARNFKTRTGRGEGKGSLVNIYIGNTKDLLG